jgi:hypothetical protein
LIHVKHAPIALGDLVLSVLAAQTAKPPVMDQAQLTA